MAQGLAQAVDVDRAARAQACAQLHETLAPRVEVLRPGLQRRVPLSEDALELASGLPVGRPQGRAGTVEKLPALAHRAAHHPQAIGRVHDHLQPAVVLPRRDLTSVHPQPAGAGHDLDLQARAPVRRDRRRLGAQPFSAAADEGLGLIRAERTAAREQAHGLEQARLALRVAPHQHVQPGRQIQARLPHVTPAETFF